MSMKARSLRRMSTRGSVTVTRTKEDARRQAGTRLLKLIDQARVRPSLLAMSEAQVDELIEEGASSLRRSRRPRE